MIPLLCRIWSGCSGYKAVSLFVALLLFTIFTPFSAQAQSERPKIGLALSGGGALGLAHIGTLKVMEEAGLRPDYITGVSMGSIIGGFYSIGYSADSLYKMFRRADWNLVLSNNIPENKVIFTEKKFFNNSIMSLPITSRKVQLPTGLIRGQQIESLLSYYAWPAADIDDFSNLPIPFLCLGTDLVTCRKVVLKSGYLPDAIRASMAVPSIFTPVKIDTAVLIDGGFVRNIAVSEIKEMGADIIIGSYTGFHRINEEELQSATGVLKQLSFFNSYNDYEEEKKKIDYLIEPVLKGLPVYGFTNTDSIIRRGYKAALPFREKFKKLADSLNRIAPQKPIRNILDKKSYVFDRISVTGNEINSDKQILGVLDVNPHERINKRQLTERIELLYGRAWFEKVKYRIVPKNDSLILMIDCIEKPKALLYGSIHYDNSIRAGLLIGLSARNLISGRSVLDISTFIGQFYRFRSSFTQFVDHNQLFGISAAFNGDYTLLPMMILRNEAGQVKRRLLSTGLSLNERIGLNHMMTISANFENLSLIPDYISASQTKRITYNYLTFNYLNELNTLDSKYFPRRGTQFQISANLSSLLNGSIKTPGNRQTYNEGNPGDFQFKRSYSLVSGLRQYLSASGKLTFMVGGDFLFTYTADSILSPAFTFFLGGQDITTDKSIPMTGFFSNEIPVEKLVRLALDADFAVSDKIHFALLTNIGMAQEPASENQWSLLGGYGLEFGYMSFIGPVRVGIMQGLSSRERYFNSIKGFISLGFNF